MNTMAMTLLAAVLQLEAPFGKYEIIEPEFPTRDFVITDYGAKPGEKATDAIAKAMSACNAAGGGRVVVPKGTWTVGNVRFKSNCDLHLEEGAVLDFLDDPKEYPVVFTTWEGVECYNLSPLIYAYEVENVAITGKGKIAPRMEFWRTWFSRPPSHMYALKCLYFWCSTNAPTANRDITKIPESRVRPHLIQFNRAKNVKLDGFEIKEAPFWMIHLYHSENCVVRNLKTFAHGHNNDGVDVDMTKNVLIEDCSFDQGDDGIVVKAGRNADAWRLDCPTENVIARNCNLNNSHSLLGVGSELSGGIRNVWVTKCRVGGTFNVLKIKTSPRRGGFVENIYIDNCEVDETDNVFHLQTDYYVQWRSFPDFEHRYTKIRNINITGFNIEKCNNTGFLVDGDWHEPPVGIHMKDIHIKATGNKFSNVDDCEDVTFENVTLGQNDGSVKFKRSGQKPVKARVVDTSLRHKLAADFINDPNFGKRADGRYELGEGVVAEVKTSHTRNINNPIYNVDNECDRLYSILPVNKDVATNGHLLFLSGKYHMTSGLWSDGWLFIPAGLKYADELAMGDGEKIRYAVVRIPTAGASSL